MTSRSEMYMYSQLSLHPRTDAASTSTNRTKDLIRRGGRHLPAGIGSCALSEGGGIVGDAASLWSSMHVSEVRWSLLQVHSAIQWVTTLMLKYLNAEVS